MPSNFPRLNPSDPRSLLSFVLATFNTAGLVLLGCLIQVVLKASEGSQ